MARHRSNPEHALAIGLVSEGILGVLALILGALFGYAPYATLRVTAHDLMLGAAASVPMMAFFSLALAVDIAPLARIRRLLDDVIGSFFIRSTLPELALIAATAGVCEELLFRGFIQAVLQDFTWPSVALVAASVIFGVAHPITGAYVLLAAASGLYLGWLWLASGNLLVPVVAHALYDFAALAVLVSQRRRELARSVDPIADE